MLFMTGNKKELWSFLQRLKSTFKYTIDLGFFFVCEAGQLVLKDKVRPYLWCIRLWYGKLKGRLKQALKRALSEMIWIINMNS